MVSLDREKRRINDIKDPRVLQVISQDGASLCAQVLRLGADLQRREAYERNRNLLRLLPDNVHGIFLLRGENRQRKRRHDKQTEDKERAANAYATVRSHQLFSPTNVKRNSSESASALYNGGSGGSGLERLTARMAESSSRRSPEDDPIARLRTWPERRIFKEILTLAVVPGVIFGGVQLPVILSWIRTK